MENIRSSKLRTAALTLVASSAAAVAVAAGPSAPAQATSACDYGSRAGSPLIGAYLTPYGGGTARSSCGTIVTPQRLAPNRVTFSGWIKDTATDGHAAVLYAQFRVGGAWGSWRTVASDTTETWRTWSYPVTASGTIDQVRIRACRYSASSGYTACGNDTIVYGF